MMKFLIKGQNIETLEHEILAADQIAFRRLYFVFDSNWKPLHKVVQFSQDCITYNRVLGTSETSCLLPSELHAGAVKMSLFGYDTDADETVRATTIVHTLHIRPSGFSEESETPVPPTPDLYQQLLQKIEKKQGADGKSAYEVAVANGFSGTESEWLLSLKGAEGVNGKDGANGKDGINGTNGKDGVDGKDGTNGIDGKNGANGIDGKDGENGKSAYEIAVANGFSGTESEWLKSLKGADGKDGADGKEGKDGITPDLSDYLKTEDLTEFKDSTQYQFQTQSETILSLENRIILLESQLSGTTTITIFSACENALTLYGSELYTIYNSAYNSIADFAANYSHFFSADNDYQLSFSTDDFGWNGTVYVVCTKELSLTESSRILLTYLSGATEAGELFLVKKPEHLDVPISVYVYTCIQNGTAIQPDFQWMQSETAVTTLTSCNVTGTYYFAFAAHSNNTSPKIQKIEILGG